MAKPAITLRSVKGQALSYTELDTNFENLRDATLTVTDGVNSTALDLNSQLEFTAGANMTITENNGVITFDATGGADLEQDLIEVGDTTTTNRVVIQGQGTGTGFKNILLQSTLNGSPAAIDDGIEIRYGALAVNTNVMNLGRIQGIFGMYGYNTSSSVLLSQTSGSGNYVRVGDGLSNLNIGVEISTGSSNENVAIRNGTLVVANLSGPPSSTYTETGAIYFDTTASEFKGYNGTNWVTLG